MANPLTTFVYRNLHEKYSVPNGRHKRIDLAEMKMPEAEELYVKYLVFHSQNTKLRHRPPATENKFFYLLRKDFNFMQGVSRKDIQRKIKQDYYHRKQEAKKND